MPDRLFKTFHYTNKSKLGKVGLVALINSYPSNNNNNNNKNHTHKKNRMNEWLSASLMVRSDQKRLTRIEQQFYIDNECKWRDYTRFYIRWREWSVWSDANEASGASEAAQIKLEKLNFSGGIAPRHPISGEYLPTSHSWRRAHLLHTNMEEKLIVAVCGTRPRHDGGWFSGASRSCRAGTVQQRWLFQPWLTWKERGLRNERGNVCPCAVFFFERQARMKRWSKNWHFDQAAR